MIKSNIASIRPFFSALLSSYSRVDTPYCSNAFWGARIEGDFKGKSIDHDTNGALLKGQRFFVSLFQDDL